MGPDPTTAYFNEHCVDYSVGRLAFACDWLAEHAGPDASLVDVGCGTGNVLAHVVATTGMRDVAGVDPSERPLQITASRVGCPTHLGSVLDDDLAPRLGRRFDVVMLVAVLHHLVGPTRRASRTLAEQAVTNSVRLVRPGGWLVVHEPVFYPPAAMWAVFHLKRVVTRLTSRRVTLFGYWNNIGAPVVSYLTNEQLEALTAPHATTVALHAEDGRVHPLQRLLGVRRRCATTLIAQRPG